MKLCSNSCTVESDAQDFKDTEENEYILIKYLQAMNYSLNRSEEAFCSVTEPFDTVLISSIYRLIHMVCTSFVSILMRETVRTYHLNRLVLEECPARS
jgi:hypothetical protein